MQVPWRDDRGYGVGDEGHAVRSSTVSGGTGSKEGVTENESVEENVGHESRKDGWLSGCVCPQTCPCMRALVSMPVYESRLERAMTRMISVPVCSALACDYVCPCVVIQN